MGLEAKCTACHGEERSVGVAHLEPKELRFQGTFSLRIPLDDVRKVSASRGELRVWWPKGEAMFALGKAAEKWMLKIRYPKSVMDKLGVQAGMRIAVLGVEDEEFTRQLKERVPEVSSGRALRNSDLIFFGIAAEKDLKKLSAMRKSLQPAGAVWTVYRKGRKELSESMVRAAGLAAGLVDIKVVGFSETHTSLKWVIPVAARK